MVEFVNIGMQSNGFLTNQRIKIKCTSASNSKYVWLLFSLRFQITSLHCVLTNRKAGRDGKLRFVSA